MDNDDLMKLFHEPLQVRPEAVAEAARILDAHAHDQEALEKAAEKRLQKQLRNLNSAKQLERVV